MTILRDQFYGREGDPERSLDLYFPGGDGPFPLVVWIHGGGWHSGDKDITFAGSFTRRGLALASVNYRLTKSGHPFPAQIDDCAAAVRWLLDGRFPKIDMEACGVIGHSAGAHLAALLAVCSGTDTPFSAARGLPVAAAVLWAGPFDLDRSRGEWPRSTFAWNPQDLFCRTFFPGGAYDEEFGNWASPASYTHGGMPPLVIVHGERDHIVPIGQAEAFARAAEAHGCRVIYRSEPERSHDLVSAEECEQAAEYFLEELCAPGCPKSQG